MISQSAAHSLFSVQHSIPDRTTLLVYWYLCSTRSNRKGVRKVQRALGFSSPSSAAFHLDKLVEMKLVEKVRDGQYQVITFQKFGLMKRFFWLGWWCVPKHLVYALVTTIVILCVFFLLVHVIGWWVVLALLPAVLAVAIQWYEGILLWHQRPSFKNDAKK